MTSAALRQARRALVVSVLAVAAATNQLPGTAWAVEGGSGSSGTDTSLPPTDSQLTVSGRGSFSQLRVTVNQTKQLANQAISVTWTGGTPTTNFGGIPFGEHYLQMFQCWGDDDGSVPGNPGPPPEQCQQGAVNGEPGGTKTGLLFGENALSRIISQSSAPNFDPTLGTLDEFGQVSLPFRAVDGTVVPQWRNTKFKPAEGGDYWLNPYFDIAKTNEIAGSRTASSGKGADLFEATTGLESRGLGCGQKVQKLVDQSTKVPRCWLVIVPRGGAADEHEGANIDPFSGVATSPLAPAAWRNRIAVPLEFNPVDSSCSLSADQRRLIGSELLLAAVSSWQPALCAVPGLAPYSYGSVSDGSARRQLLSKAPGSPGMAVISRPFDPSSLDAQNPIVYAPLTLSGTVIGFNVERVPKVVYPEGLEPPAEVQTANVQLGGVRVGQLNLTPRLVAKLLTQSYRSQVEINASKPPYAWGTKNPANVVDDPDFLQFNPEFILLRSASKNMGGLVMPGPNSDAALQVWEWVLSDAEARAWLSGAPDPFGMNVNPYYSTSASLNPEGVGFGDPLPESYPKTDPYCYQEPEVGPLKIKAPPLCGLDWLPYTQGLRPSARATRAAADGAKTTVNRSPASPDQVYKRDAPQALGQRGILSITDTASAAQFGVQAARLSRAGDNGADRSFIAPDQAGLAAGGQAMAPKAVPDFLEPSPATAPPGAYPLTALTYAAIAPLGLDATARREYAAFVDYAAGPGQEPGYEYGQLPPGYQPLPDGLRAQGRAAATRIRDLTAVGEVDAPSADSNGGSSPQGTGPSETPGAGGATEALDPSPGSSLGPGPSSGPGAAVPLLPIQQEKTPKSPIERVFDAVATPLYRLAATRYALPVLVVVALLAGLGVLEITKRRSRRNPRLPATMNGPGTL